jgi:hypothetical protein
MKTKISTTILLALSIQVMVNGQTQGNPVNVQSNISEKKILSPLDGQNQAKHMAASSKITTPIAQKTNITLSAATVEELLRLAESISAQAEQIRNVAKTKSPKEKNKLLAEVRTLEEQALTRQVEASEVTEKLNQQQFYHNKITIRILVSNFNGEKNTLVYTYNLIIESEKDMKLAKEMREESYAQANLASRLGNMSNAEERELLALSKQNQVIDVLAKAPSLASNAH